MLLEVGIERKSVRISNKSISFLDLNLKRSAGKLKTVTHNLYS